MPRTLASFLADLSEQDLREMLSGIEESRDRLRQEEDSLAVEAALVDSALVRKARRTGGRAASRTGTATGEAGGPGKLTRRQVQQIIHEMDVNIFRPVDVFAVLQGRGFDVTADATRQHLRRLARDGKLGREGDSYFKLGSPNGDSSHLPPKLVPDGEEETWSEGGTRQGAG
jgi:hypothetical protein